MHLLLVERKHAGELLLELMLQRLELAKRVLRARYLRRAKLAAGDLRADPLLRRLDLTDPGSERLRHVRETLAGRTVVACLRGAVGGRAAAMAEPEAETA